uniref:Uncharacterized protein n=1 Tax=Tanacetum cinerariifolium TaxID=118510 RepID=A0A6L2NVF6_TANCI|nr:hypothetical protein [Tanacetum cinerariifolium]
MSTSKQGHWRNPEMTAIMLCFDCIYFSSIDLHTTSVVNEHLLDEDIEKIVKGDEESDANKFAEDMINNKEDIDTKIDLRSHKEKTLKVVVPEMVNKTTDHNMKDNIPMIVDERIRMEREKTKADMASMVADDETCFSFFILAELMLIRNRDHEDHLDDDARPERESSAKRQRTSEHSTYTRGESSSQTMKEPNSSSSGAQE